MQSSYKRLIRDLPNIEALHSLSLPTPYTNSA
jgi:hypothetical protein